MFLTISMVSSISLFIFNFWHFYSLFIIIFWIILLFFLFQNIQIIWGWVCVVGSSHFLCLSTHDLFLGLFFKIKLNWGFCFYGVYESP